MYMPYQFIQVCSLFVSLASKLYFSHPAFSSYLLHCSHESRLKMNVKSNPRYDVHEWSILLRLYFLYHGIENCILVIPAIFN